MAALACPLGLNHENWSDMMDITVIMNYRYNRYKGYKGYNGYNRYKGYNGYNILYPPFFQQK